ncbi:MAG: hypothetical protein MJ193_01290, partial [Clostridia bacterium]|nr:hypothetical protein [Clostridia bacterium]
MKRLRFLLLAVLIVCMVCTFFACSPSNPVKPSDVGPIDDDRPDTPVVDDPAYMTASAAWEKLKDGALKINQGKSRYFNFDCDVFIDYFKDETGNTFTLRSKGSIDTVDDKNSEFVFEFYKTPYGTDEKIFLFGFYYIGSKDQLIYDASGIKKGAYAVKTDELSMGQFISDMSKVFHGLVGDDGSLASFLYNEVFGLEIPVVGSVSSLIEKIVSSETRLVDLGGGKERLIMPCDFGDLFGTIIGVLTSILSGKSD